MGVTPHDVVKAKGEGRAVVCLTAYDFPTAALVDQAGVDIILVGDSLGMVVQGRRDTLGVTVDQMVYHTEMVSRAATRALVVADMPFMSYQASATEGVKNAGRLVQEGGAGAVKLEGAQPETLELIDRIVRTGIPVMGHIGYTPQSSRSFGRDIVRGKTLAQARSLLDDARRLEACGCFAIVLEMAPRGLGGLMSKRAQIPIIGIGSGPECDGQILVLHDMIGFYLGYSPKFVRKLADVSGAVSAACREFVDLVVSRRYPGEGEFVELGDDVWENIIAEETRDP